MASLLTASGRPGFYFRVLEEGEVGAGDRIEWGSKGPELNGKACGGLHACVRYKTDDDELMDTVRLELQIQVGVGKAAGAPMLKRYDVARLGRELGADLATPRSVFEGLM